MRVFVSARTCGRIDMFPWMDTGARARSCVSVCVRMLRTQIEQKLLLSAVDTLPLAWSE